MNAAIDAVPGEARGEGLGEARGDMLGWDIGGAHVKAAWLRDGRVHDVVQWPCALWKGLGELQAVLERARARWPALRAPAPGLRHAVTMSGEMVDGFADRRTGVHAITAVLAAALAPRAGTADRPSALQLYAGARGWVAAERLPHEAAAWADIASANWHATACDVAGRLDAAVLVDLGSTTTDLIPVRGGAVLSRSRSDADRLACGELVYQGLVRTPLCALGPRVAFRDRSLRLMNEWFATSADVYRLTGELDEAHDQHPSADQGAKTPDGSRRRLARMIGLDAADATDADWQALAQAFRSAQLAQLDEALDEVQAAHGLQRAPLVAAGCGAALVHALAARRGLVSLDYAGGLVPTASGTDGTNDKDALGADHADDAREAGRGALRRWAGVAAPAVAVASLASRTSWAAMASPTSPRHRPAAAGTESGPCGS